MRNATFVFALSSFFATLNAEDVPVREQLSVPAYTDFGVDQKLRPLFAPGKPATKEAWEEKRKKLRAAWDEVLGRPSFDPDKGYDKKAKLLETFERPKYRAKLYRQPTGPGAAQLALVLEPKEASKKPRPGALVPFYHPDASAGFDLQKREQITEGVTIQFGRHLVQQGYVVVCTEAFPYNTVEKPKKSGGFSWWHAAAKKILTDNPNWTGMGKLIHDTSRGVDLLLEQENVDADRIVAIGHSLGGKMVFYTGALDERIDAVIATDFGIGWDFTNWNDPWYLGDQILERNFKRQHHELLALMAPRAFLLVAGQYDKPESWPYLLEAQKVWTIYGKKTAIGMLDHAQGHRPTKKSIRMAYRWLAETFSLPTRRYEF